MSYRISLPTNATFLRSRFSLVRAGLVGKKKVSSVPGALVFQSLDSGAEITQKKIFPDVVPARLKLVSKSILDKVALLAIACSLLIGLVLLVPQFYYAFTPVDTVPLQTSEDGTVLGGSFEEGTQADKQQNQYLPEKNENLPEGEWLVIPRIGVRTPLRETANAEEALAEGVWKVPGYGDAGSIESPVILAAHRFGWEWWWQSDYWKYNSFYLLPDTQPGDIVEVIADQRKWTYEIYDGAEGDAIADYDADLILYTCKFLNSPVRHFRYARLINPNVDTQG